jgi:GNAT superfamily N-acetyltransferase
MVPMTGDVARWRTLMGAGIGPWVDHPGMVHRVEPTSWLSLSGLPSPDVNMALVHDDDPGVLADAVRRIDEMRAPALVLLAGEGRSRAGDLAEPWMAVGEMPMMSIDLDAAVRRPDGRVRRAGRDDREAVVGLLAEAFQMTPDVLSICVGPLDRQSEVMGIWLLEDDGEPVSTVTTARVDEVVSIWCMATPERLARRGYGSAILAAVLDHHHAEGARTGLLGATPAGQPLYEATGWQHVEQWQIFTNAESAQFSH